MDFSFLGNDLGYLLWGTFPDGPPGGALLTLMLAASGAVLSAVLGLALSAIHSAPVKGADGFGTFRM